MGFVAGWRPMASVVGLGVALCAWSSCASGSSATRDEGAASAEAQQPVQAKDDLVVVFENLFNVPEDAPIAPELLAPKTVEDAQNIVRSDNTALFSRAETVFAEHIAKHPDDLVNLTWHAQLYLAWADSAAVTHKTLQSSTERLQAKLDKLLAQRSSTAASDLATLDDEIAGIQALIPITEKVMQDLGRIAEEKLEIGKEKSRVVLEKSPDTYEGFRLAADYYRLSSDWEQYEASLRQLQRRNPDSNGLLFLKGVVALQRDKDYQTAESYLGKAVANDPKFAKAQYYLALTLLNSRRFDEASEAMARTLEISPAHPFANAVRTYIDRLRQVGS